LALIVIEGQADHSDPESKRNKEKGVKKPGSNFKGSRELKSQEKEGKR